MFHSIRLFKDQPLGSGSYGVVCRAECDCLPCTAKIIHQALFQIEDPSCFVLPQRFERECLGNSNYHSTNPGPPNRIISYDGDRIIQEVIPEVERRESHIHPISSTHPLFSLITSCLCSKRKDRPTAQTLYQRPTGLKHEPR